MTAEAVFRSGSLLSVPAIRNSKGRGTCYIGVLEEVERNMTGTLWFAPARTSSAVVLASLAALGCSTPAGAQTVDQLYALAKEEKTLVMWAAGPTAPYESAARAFEQKFPGITVSLMGGFSNVLNARIEEQVKTKKVETDLAILQTIQDFIAWKGRGLLLPFKPDGFDKIDNRSKDKDGAWIAVNKNPIFYGYNTDQVHHNDVPKLATEFLRPQFKGKIISAYPADDDATLFAFATIVQKYGWGYMAQYMKQQPKFVQGHLGVARSLGSGESLVSFDATVSSTLDVQRAGGKVALAGSTDDYLPVFFTAEAILKDAPHPSAAKLYVTWFLSKEWQSRTGVYSSRSDVPPPAELPPLSSFRLEERYVEFMSSENLVADLRKRFESYTGPVTNAGGVK
jgi:ABC-type Fe3+ transport system substrate-binding protein